MSEPPPWLAWGGGSIASAFLVWCLKQLFSAAVRQEIESMHTQNLSRFSRLENALARIEGRLQERWGDSRE